MTLLEGTRCALARSYLRNHFGYFSILDSTYEYNHIPHRSINQSPISVLNPNSLLPFHLPFLWFTQHFHRPKSYKSKTTIAFHTIQISSQHESQPIFNHLQRQFQFFPLSIRRSPLPSIPRTFPYASQHIQFT